MNRCTCANKALVASCVHPYCYEHNRSELLDELDPQRDVRKALETVLDFVEDRTDNPKFIDAVDTVCAWLGRCDKEEVRSILMSIPKVPKVGDR